MPRKHTPEEAAAAKVRRAARKKAYRQTPEAMAADKAYRDDPANKAATKARSQMPAALEAAKARSQTPAARAAAKARDADPARKAAKKARKQTPEARAAAKVYTDRPENKAAAKVAQQARLATSEGRALHNNKTARRKASKLERTVSWGCDKTIKEIYLAAAQTTAELGIQMHIDHIIPLHGIITDNCQVFMCDQWLTLDLPGTPHNVSGLHWQLNLQMLSQFDNCSKGNRITQAEALGLPPQ